MCKKCTEVEYYAFFAYLTNLQKVQNAKRSGFKLLALSHSAGALLFLSRNISGSYSFVAWVNPETPHHPRAHQTLQFLYRRISNSERRFRCSSFLPIR